MKLDYLENPKKIPLTYLTAKKGGRTFEVAEEIKVVLSDYRLVTIPKGFQTDLSSIPSWLWSILKPIDKAFIADLLHDYLWKEQFYEIQFKEGAYNARKFADNERLKWRNALAPKKKLKNYVTHYTIRLVGGLFYSRQLEIPN